MTRHDLLQLVDFPEQNRQNNLGLKTRGGWRFDKSIVLEKMMKNEQEVVCT